MKAATVRVPIDIEVGKFVTEGVAPSHEFARSVRGWETGVRSFPDEENTSSTPHGTQSTHRDYLHLRSPKKKESDGAWLEVLRSDTVYTQ